MAKALNDAYSTAFIRKWLIFSLCPRSGREGLKFNPFTTVFLAFYSQHFSEHILTVASVNKTPEDGIDSDTCFNFCN